MNAQEQAWSGKFGDEYTARNRVDWRARIGFWRQVIEATGARSVFELGCNAGWNLSAIQQTHPNVNLRGTDINRKAVTEAWNAGLSEVALGSTVGQPPSSPMAELSFTCGVLIHIAPDRLPATMQTLIDLSSDFVLALEYNSESGAQEHVLYRGQHEMLWRRDYGRLYHDMGLRLVKTGDPGPPWDRCTYWLLRK